MDIRSSAPFLINYLYSRILSVFYLQLNIMIIIIKLDKVVKLLIYKYEVIKYNRSGIFILNSGPVVYFVEDIKSY